MVNVTVDVTLASFGMMFIITQTPRKRGVQASKSIRVFHRYWQSLLCTS